MTKYTPGPWRIARVQQTGQRNIETSDGTVIAVSLEGLDGNAEANARLIAEAPAMAEALRLNWEHTDDAGKVFYCNCVRYASIFEDSNQDDDEKHSTACAEARAVLTRIEGKG